MSALYRMAYSDHKIVEINNHDLVIISATAIPGNEKLVNKVVNELYRSGAEVVNDALAGVHVSGHACQEELKQIFAITKPKYFIPVHGEYRHLKKHSILARSMGIEENNIVVADIGDIIEVSDEKIEIVGTVPSGKVLVDGLGVGDVGNIVLRDRMHLSQDGLIIAVAIIDNETRGFITEAEIISRGFVYTKENEGLYTVLKKITEDTVLKEASNSHSADWEYSAKNAVKDALTKYVYEQTKRKPMILPVVKTIY